MIRREWILKRNCSLAPRQLVRAYAVLCGFSLVVAMPFTLRGAWHIIAWSVLEMLGVAVAFLYYARHVNDLERIVIDEGGLTIEQVRADHVHAMRFTPCWTRIAPPKAPRDLIRIEAQGKRIEVGRFVTDARRRQIAREIRTTLREFA